MNEQEKNQPTTSSHRQANQDYFEKVDGNAYTAPVTIHQHLTPSETTDSVALRRAYLTRLLHTASRVELTGIDRKAAGQEIATGLNLSAIYTALLTLSTEDQEDSRQRKGLSRPLDLGTARRLSALAQVNRHKHVVLLGDPGSGKSTFVKFMAVCLAGELLGDEHVNLTLLTAPLPQERDQEGDEKGPRQHWDHGAVLPVLVVLRDFAAKGLPAEGQPATARHLWEFIARMLEQTMLGNYAPALREVLQGHGGVILLDGLDEVPEASLRRTQIKQAVEDFTLSFPQCRIVVTSRIYAYQEQEWRLDGFAEAVLAPFSDAQIRFFADHWYAHMAFIRGMDRENAQGRAELLKRAIFSSDRLHDFATRPLLLTLMASLHAWRGGSLPEKRGELYAEATDLLLDWWERDKIVRDVEGTIAVERPSLSELLRVGKDRVQQVLNALAFDAQQSQSQLKGTADILEERLVGKLMHICRNDNVNPVLLVKHLSDRAGLLVPHGVGVYSFPHRTFQEYLAACHLTGQDEYPDNVAELACQDPNRWREVLLLAAARASDVAPMIWVLVEALCYQDLHDAEITSQHVWGALLAGQALVEIADLDRVSPRNLSKLHKVRDWLTGILTEQVPTEDPFPVVERALAGNMLAHLGDPRPGIGLREDGLPEIDWCEVPAGKFLMGSDPEKDQEAYEDEQPQHTVQVSAFRISRYPVTNAQYQSFVKDGGYTDRWRECWEKEGWTWKEEEQISEPRIYGREFDLPNHPVVGVSWYEAAAFCHWLTLRFQDVGELSEGQKIRLPTEAEWEKAARGEDGRMYPWRDQKITTELANYDDTGLGTTNAVGCFPRGASPYGCEEMIGNVYEWCVDWFDDEYYTRSPGNDPSGPETGSRRVIRGGSWIRDARCCRAAYRAAARPTTATTSSGSAF